MVITSKPDASITSSKRECCDGSEVAEGGKRNIKFSTLDSSGQDLNLKQVHLE
jgi:hypothetical protein